MHADEMLGHGIRIGHDTVGLLMRRAGLTGLPFYRRRGKRAPRGITVTKLGKRNFTRTGPNQLWVTDITVHRTREGKVFCCVMLDTFTRRVVGWATVTLGFLIVLIIQILALFKVMTFLMLVGRSALPLTPRKAAVKFFYRVQVLSR